MQTSLKLVCCAVVLAAVCFEQGIAGHLDDPKSVSEIVTNNPLARGWGDNITWVKWENAISTAQETGKPILLLIHKSWCSACKALKLLFNQTPNPGQFLKMSEWFVMVNVMDDEEPMDRQFAQDGRYIPRVYFLDTQGRVMPEIKNPMRRADKYLYFYGMPNDVFVAMNVVMRELGIGNYKKVKLAADREARAALWKKISHMFQTGEWFKPPPPQCSAPKTKPQYPSPQSMTPQEYRAKKEGRALTEQEKKEIEEAKRKVEEEDKPAKAEQPKTPEDHLAALEKHLTEQKENLARITKENEARKKEEGDKQAASKGEAKILSVDGVELDMDAGKKAAKQ